jgi:prepilin-type N-terminal cleavage/methylation domain-containing protein
MADSLRAPCRDEGFTLPELLVSIMIVAILVAIAIPTFLSTQAQANDASAKEMAASAENAAETLALDNGGSYATVRKATLHRYDATLATAKANTDAYLSAASGTASTYTLTVTSVVTGTKFTLSRAADGTITRTCKLSRRTAPHGGCEIVKGTKGNW